MAQKYDVHIMFVAHPRKAMGFLRLDDISGTADIGNAVDNAFIVHRVNNDFKRLSMQMFGWKADDDLYTASNVIEIAKDRDGGLQDYFIPLYYEVESKRLKTALRKIRFTDGAIMLMDLLEQTGCRFHSSRWKYDGRRKKKVLQSDYTKLACVQ